MHCLSLLTIGSFLTGLIVRGSTRWYRHDLSQVGRILGFGFTTSAKARAGAREGVLCRGCCGGGESISAYKYYAK